MGKKNIKPNLNQPVIRTHIAKPALEGLREENLTTTSAITLSEKGLAPGGLCGCGLCGWGGMCNCSYDGDDAE